MAFGVAGDTPRDQFNAKLSVGQLFPLIPCKAILDGLKEIVVSRRPIFDKVPRSRPRRFYLLQVQSEQAVGRLLYREHKGCVGLPGHALQRSSGSKDTPVNVSTTAVVSTSPPPYNTALPFSLATSKTGRRLLGPPQKPTAL